MKAIRDDQEKLLISAWYSMVNYFSIKSQIKQKKIIFRVVHFNDENLKND